MTTTYKADPDSNLIMYAVSIFAWKPQTHEAEHRAFVILGDMGNDPQKAGVNEARRLWPAQDGWQDHHAQVHSVEIQFRSTPQIIEAPEETTLDFVM